MSEKLPAEKTIVDGVLARVGEFVQQGTLQLPRDYAAGNALRAAWLILQDKVDKDNRPVLMVCKRDSISYALLRMVVEGMNPAKDQCYFIAYGDKLTYQRSYFGAMMLAKRANQDIDDFPAQVVYSSDTFEVEIVHGKTLIKKHVMKGWGQAKGDIIGAYCQVVFRTGKIFSTTLMTMEQIKQAWSQSKMRPVADNGAIKPGTTHDKFTVDMCLKTVISKACKPIINSSSDTGILGQFIREDLAMEFPAEERLDNEIAARANAEVIDVDTETGEVKQQAETAPASDEPVVAGF